MALRVLFIGGTGIISSACADLAVRRGIDLTVLNRGTGKRPLPAGAKVLTADVRDPSAVREALGDSEFDVVVDFVAFTPEHVAADVEQFRGAVGQYVFVSSASAYAKPVGHLPITESTPLRNPFWSYSRDKIACEELLTREWRENGFPAFVVRPSHTYDRTSVPLDDGWTAIDRMRRGKPVVVHGDGTSTWVLTHHADFAQGFVPLLGEPAVTGDVVHLTSDEVLTWDGIARRLASAAGVDDPRIVHVPSEVVAREAPDRGPGLLGDKAHSVVFDNTKLKRLVPGFAATTSFAQGAREIVAHHDANPALQVVDPEVDAWQDRLVERFG
ncbi:NAD-dependent epimerase/dehydratase family protein [Kineococcus rhizosphaerae]|uniref:Nucleoside-diphosphate-sugar epimerase n=1 Tax=Kineococcus rhizosphaerae TaxID=559628 RepID=A0A2T0R6X2_9ACTN|nr:NAD-dependent epimerase/dehydratase family protein [Kineococcus rhizosphaerae]PRY16917.1 nucleoside-diphosphate-sugar epimerase [Kineococcus rhizosphaerae]